MPELRHIRLDRERQRLAKKGRAGEGFLRWACRTPDGIPYDAVPATWHEIATTNSAAFPNDVGIGTGGSIGRRQLKAITQLAACSPGEYGARPRTLVSLLHRQLPDSATHTVPGAGHAAWSGAPGAFAEIASCPTTQATPAQPAASDGGYQLLRVPHNYPRRSSPIIGFVAGIAILWTLGIVVVVIIGVVLALPGMTGHAVGGRRHYF